MSDSSGERPDEAAAPNRRTVLQETASEGVQQPARRGVLKAAVASAAAALGFTDAAAAFDPARRARLWRVERRYRAEGAALDAVEAHGGDVLARLADEGYLARASADELGDVDVAATEADGAFTAHVTAATDLDEGRLVVAVQPEVDRGYAVLDRADGEGFVVFDPASDGPEPKCPAGYGCEGDGCVCPEWEVACCDGNCYKVQQTGFSCSGCTACATDPCQYGC